MHALSATDPLAWLLVSYLIGSVVCGAWTLGLRVLSAALRRAMPGRRGPLSTDGIELSAEP
jgi:hypothetical protein